MVSTTVFEPTEVPTSPSAVSTTTGEPESPTSSRVKQPADTATTALVMSTTVTTTVAAVTSAVPLESTTVALVAQTDNTQTTTTSQVSLTSTEMLSTTPRSALTSTLTTTSSSLPLTTTGAPVPVSDAAPGSTLLVASLRLTVTDVNGFLSDDFVKRAVAAGVAAALRVKSSYVTIVMKKARRLRLAEAKVPASGDVVVDYTVTLPPSATKEEKMSMTADPSVDDLNAHIQFKVAATTAFSIDVTSKTAPSISIVKDDGTLEATDQFSGAGTSFASIFALLAVSVLAY